MMRLKQFKRMTDAYGADSGRWPERLRSGAQALLERSLEARELLDRARELDDALTVVTAARDARIAGKGESNAAEVRLRSGVLTRIGASEHPEAPKRSGYGGSWLIGGLDVGLWRRRWIGLTATASVAVLGGLALGLAYSPSPPQTDVVTLLQPAPVPFLVD
jgi:hypothetical protein